MGAVTVIADVHASPGDTSQVAARLLDVAPDGTETLVDRGLWRPATGGPTKQVFQLHPNGWNFAEGHVPKLELIAADAADAGLASPATGGPSNGQQADHRLEPRAADAGRSRSRARSTAWSRRRRRRSCPRATSSPPTSRRCRARRPKLTGKKLKVKGGKAIAKVSCPAAFVACNDVEAVAERPGQEGKVSVGRAELGKVKGGKSAKLKVKLSGKAKKTLKKKPKLKVSTELTISEVER